METKKVKKGCHEIEGEVQTYTFMCYDMEKCKRSSAFFCTICAPIFHKDHQHEKLELQCQSQKLADQVGLTNSTLFNDNIKILKKYFCVIDLVVQKLCITLLNLNFRGINEIENEVKKIKSQLMWQTVRNGSVEESNRMKIFEILEIFMTESYYSQISVEEANKFRKIVLSVDPSIAERRMKSLEKFYDENKKSSQQRRISKQILKDQQRRQITQRQTQYFLQCLKKILSPAAAAIPVIGTFLNAKQKKQKQGEKKLEYMEYLVKVNKELEDKLSENEKKLESYKKIQGQMQEKIDLLVKEIQALKQTSRDRIELVQTSTFAQENDAKKKNVGGITDSKKKKKNKYADIDEVIPEEPTITQMISKKAFQSQSLKRKEFVMSVSEGTNTSSLNQLSFKVICNNDEKNTGNSNEYTLSDQISFNKKTSAETNMIPSVPKRTSDENTVDVSHRRYSITNEANLHPVGAKRFSLGDLQRKNENQRIIKQADPKLKNKLIRQAQSLKGNFDSYFRQGENMLLKCQIITTAIDFTSVKILKLSNNNIRDLGLLSLVNFKNVKYLLLNNNLIESIAPLCEVDFRGIQVFSLDFNLIEDIACLARMNLRNIKVLSMNNNRIQRLYPLVSVNFRNLQGLALSNNLIRDPNPLKELDYKLMFWVELKNNKFEKEEMQWIKKANLKNKNGSKICLYI